jgi:hypothetical protein
MANLDYIMDLHTTACSLTSENVRNVIWGFEYGANTR